jgi:hypothetical protein
MGIKRNHNRAGGLENGSFSHLPEQFLMPPVDSIEVTDGNDRADRLDNGGI